MSTVLGLFLLAVYIAAIVGLAAFVTFLAIRISPTRRDPTDKPDAPSSDGDSLGGRLFRKAKRGIP